MDFIFEAVLEIIMAPYVFAMMRLVGQNNKVNKQKIKGFVILECIVLSLLFIAGCVMMLETNGTSLWGKVMILSATAVSVIQIVVGAVLRKVNKEK